MTINVAEIPDIYYLPKYGKSVEYLIDGEFNFYKYQDQHGSIIKPFIKRHIVIGNVTEDIYDIQTPYGYGGPIITELTGNKKILLNNYQKDFADYCRENNIICEFIRFHPILKNYLDFNEIYEISYMRKTIATILKDKKDPFTEEFSKGARKTIRKILREDITYEVIESPSNLEQFIKIYYDTMIRNDADDYYFFGADYFSFLLKEMRSNLLNINVFFDGKCISSGLYLKFKNYLHAHLSGTDHNYLHLSPAYLLKYLTLQWGIENHIDYIHYGGGTTNNEDDPLLQFKSRFTKEGFFDFYIGKKIYDNHKYDYLVQMTKTQKEKFFPQYRA